MPYRVLSLNVDSIIRGGRRQQLDRILSENVIDIALIQETKLEPGSKFNLKNFNIFRYDIRRGWGGTAVLVKCNIFVRNFHFISSPFHATFVDVKNVTLFMLRSPQLTKHPSGLQ